MKSSAFGRIIAGPVGSGKTTACVIELLRRSMAQEKAPDGYRYSRWAIVRQTLKQLKDTVLKDCNQWLTGLGEWRVSENTFHVKFGDVISEWVFIPLEDSTDQARLLSMQLTGAWLSECIEMSYSVLGPISGRLGRYPSASRGNPTWFGMIADTNMPTELSPWHKHMENPPPDWQVFIQPGGMTPYAENLNFLVQTAETIRLPFDHPKRIAQGRKYYERFVSMYGEDSDWVKRYVHAQYGDDPSGMAVFRQTFKTAFHVVDSTNVLPGYPIIVGQDFGRDPWSVICQVDHLGRLLIHEEVAGTNVGLEKHVTQTLRARLMSSRYFGSKIFVVGDPSGVAKSTHSEESSFDLLRRIGLSAFPAPTNDIDPRLRAVEALLGRQVHGGPAIMFNRQGCPTLIRAMAGGYRFTKTKLGGLRAVPEKNDPEGYSHVSDALQYACLVAHGGLVEEFARRVGGRPKTTSRPKFTSAAWT